MLVELTTSSVSEEVHGWTEGDVTGGGIDATVGEQKREERSATQRREEKRGRV